VLVRRGDRGVAADVEVVRARHLLPADGGDHEGQVIMKDSAWRLPSAAPHVSTGGARGAGRGHGPPQRDSYTILCIRKI
jgi:hypothetical protein